ncbi:MAG: hypothetical protein ABEI96_02410 [Haloarculaceae archaeon]
MMEDVKRELTETVRQEAQRRARKGRAELEHRADEGRQELGQHLLGLTEEYFPEAVRQRRRRDVAGGFVAGAAVGFAVRHLLRD